MTSRGYNVDEEAIRQAKGTWFRYREQFVRVLRKNPNLLIGLIVLTFFIILCGFAQFWERIDPLMLDPDDRLQGPNWKHWFGTDNAGRDIYSRTLHGGRVSLMVGFFVAVFTTLVGMVLGLISGYTPKIDIVLQRIMDSIMSFPTLLLALALVAMLGSSMWNVIGVITFVDTPRMVRIVRATVLTLREQMYIDAARALGTPTWRILFVHLAPNTMAPVLVQATYVFALAILTEASLSFLGLGIPPENPSWGNILALGRTFLQQAFWISFFPGFLLTINVMAMNLVGDGLRDAFDPKMSRSV
jgi:peptide/nickel transport system permease protein